MADASTAAMYMANGASFVAGSLWNPEAARVCNQRKVTYLPECASAEEVAEAEELGVEICRVSGQAGSWSPADLRALLGRRPWSRVMLAGGSTSAPEDSAWIAAGAVGMALGSSLIPTELVEAGDFQGITDRIAAALSLVRKARGLSPFGPIEHVGVYVREGSTVEAIAEWYRRAFDYRVVPAREGYFVGNEIFGRIEAMNAPVGEACHMAIRVWDFEAAVEQLRARGFELREPRISPTSKLVYLKDRDPAGNLVHIVWRA